MTKACIKYRNLVLSGEIGTGTTTLAKNLSLKLGWKHINTGDYVRNWYREHNIPLEQTDKFPEELDKSIDQSFKAKIIQDSKTVFESRLGGWLAQGVDGIYKILCIVGFDESVKRVSKRDNISQDQARREILERSRSLKEKFKRLYGVDGYLNPQYFDLIVDTQKLNQAQSQELVLENINQ